MVGDPCRKPFFVSLDEEDEYITILGEEGVQFLVLSMGLVDGLIYIVMCEFARLPLLKFFVEWVEYSVILHVIVGIDESLFPLTFG